MEEKDFIGKTAGEVRWADNGAYCYFHPHDLPFDIKTDPATHRVFMETAMALARLDGKVSDMRSEEIEVLRMAFTLKESTMSSTIEGTRSTLDDVYRSERMTEKNEIIDRDNREIRNYKKALDDGFEKIGAGDPISIDLIRELHKILMENVRGADKSPGEFKTEQNAIGRPGDTLASAKIVPASPGAVDHLLDNLILYIRSDRDVMEQVALAHYQFESIHPFKDGNGRIGRLLIPLILYDKGILHYPILYLSEYFNAHRQEYLNRLYAVSAEDRFNEWFLFFMTGLKTQAEHSIKTIDRLRNYHRFLTENESNSNIMHTIDLLFKNPYIRSKDISEAVGITTPAANNIIRLLEERHILREITGKKRNRVYVADEILEILKG